MEQKLFAIKSPSKILLWDTAASSRTKAWDAAYRRHLYQQYMHEKNPTKAAYSRGWRCVPVQLVEIPII